VLGIRDPLAAMTLDAAAWEAGEEQDREVLAAMRKAGVSIAPPWR
jgi:hypothetical protein